MEITLVNHLNSGVLSESVQDEFVERKQPNCANTKLVDPRRNMSRGSIRRMSNRYPPLVCCVVQVCLKIALPRNKSNTTEQSNGNLSEVFDAL